MTHVFSAYMLHSYHTAHDHPLLLSWHLLWKLVLAPTLRRCKVGSLSHLQTLIYRVMPYDYRVSCILHPVVAGLRPPFENSFYGTPMCR